MIPENEQNNLPLTPSAMAELKELIAASSERELLPAESERLEKALASSRDARSVYIGYMQLDADLDWTIRGNQSVDGIVERSRHPETLIRDLDRLEQAARPMLRRMRLLSILALAASVSFVAASIAWFWPPAAHKADGNFADNSMSAVANIVQLSKDCSWFVENRRSNDGTVRAGDKVRLTRGQVRMDFACGATVTMRSPAALEIISPMRTRAVLGTLKAHVGKGAEGFTVETPRTTVVDLGTDFGVDVSRHGSTDVVVFNGAVDLHSDGIDGLSARQRLSAGEGVRVSGEGTASRIVSILDSQFSVAEVRRARDRTPAISEVRDNVRRGESWKYYEIVHGGMREDTKAFVDREHEWNGVYPAGMPRYLLGADYVKTFNDDKLNREVEIRVTLARPCILYVLLDKRSPVPNWLRERFFNTGDVIGLDGGKYTRFGERKSLGVGAGVSIDDVFSVWRLDVPAAETVTLGAIQAGGETHNMYGIAAVPMELRSRHDAFAGSRDHPAKKSTPLVSGAQGQLAIDATIERPKEANVFRFDWKGGIAEVACQTNGFTTLDPVVSVYDSEETLVGYARATRIGRERTAVKMNLPVGLYYVTVTGSDDVGEVGTYHLEVAPASGKIAPPLRASRSLVLKGAQSKTGVQLSWSELPNAKSYTLEKSTDAVNFQAIATTEGSRFDANVDPSHLVVYRVRGESSDHSASAPLLISAAAPAVTHVQAFGSSPGCITVEWRDVLRDRGYRIERSQDDGPFAAIGTAVENACGYRDADIAPGTKYAYRVATINSPMQETYSEPVAAMSGVGDIQATLQADGTVALTWKAEYSKARFLIERAVGGPESFLPVGAVSGDVRRFVDRKVVAGEEPRYRVVALENVTDLPEVKKGTIDRVRLPGWLQTEDFFALRITGQINIERTGKRHFYLTSDDGSRLFLDGALVVNNDERHPERTVSGTVELAAGVHDFEVQYFQSEGDKKLALLWAGMGVTYSEVPREILSSLQYHFYKGHWARLPFDRSCAVSDVVRVKAPADAAASQTSFATPVQNIQ
jgi:hypothetical protein